MDITRLPKDNKIEFKLDLPLKCKDLELYVGVYFVLIESDLIK
jgi:hypothetical protein